jgi:hypothetical protein
MKAKHTKEAFLKQFEMINKGVSDTLHRQQVKLQGKNQLVDDLDSKYQVGSVK